MELFTAAKSHFQFQLYLPFIDDFARNILFDALFCCLISVGVNWTERTPLILSSIFNLLFFQEHKMASVRDDSHDMNPLMMDNPVFATGSSINLFCPLCHEMFNNPRLLPCLHTFCKRCLENLVVPRSSSLSCPACRTDVVLTVFYLF